MPPLNWPGGAGSPGPTLTFALRFRPVRAGGKFISRFLSPVRLQTPIFKAIEKVYAIKAVATFLRPSPLPPSGSPWEGSGSALAAAPAFHGPGAQTNPQTAASVTPWPGPGARELPPPHDSWLWGYQDLFRIVLTEAVGGWGPRRAGGTHRGPSPPPRGRGEARFFLKI